MQTKYVIGETEIKQWASGNIGFMVQGLAMLVQTEIS